MRRQITLSMLVILIYETILPGLSIAQSIQSSSEAINTKFEKNQEIDFRVLRADMNNAGMYLKKAYKTYNPGLKTLDMIAEMEDPYIGLFLTFVVLPFDYTFTRSIGKFKSAHNIGLAGDKFIDASTFISSKRVPFMKTAGQNLKKYRTYGYWSNGIFYSGVLAVAIEAARVYGGALSGEEKETRSSLITAGGIAMLTGWGLGLLPSHYAGNAGKNLKEVMEIFPSDKERKLMEESGNGLQSFSKNSYWGRGLLALGITLTYFGQDNKTMLTTGILTAAVGWIISDFIAPKGIKSAGEKLEDL